MILNNSIYKNIEDTLLLKPGKYALKFDRICMHICTKNIKNMLSYMHNKLVFIINTCTYLHI